MVSAILLLPGSTLTTRTRTFCPAVTTSLGSFTKSDCASSRLSVNGLASHVPRPVANVFAFVNRVMKALLLCTDASMTTSCCCGATDNMRGDRRMRAHRKLRDVNEAVFAAANVDEAAKVGHVFLRSAHAGCTKGGSRRQHQTLLRIPSISCPTTVFSPAVL
jgi:hypothetical protein